MTTGGTSPEETPYTDERLRDRRRVAGVVAAALVLVAMAAYLTFVAARSSSPPLGESVRPGNMLFVDMSDGQNKVEQAPPTDPRARTTTGLRCQRVYSAAGTTVCLRLAGAGPTFEAAILDSSGEVIRTMALPGIPSRARVSPSGQVVTWTSFVTGDSYAVPGGFSTRTGFVNLSTGVEVESIEHFAVTVRDQQVTAADRNFWGLTVADDDRTFYATLATGGRTWLVTGDLDTGIARDVRSDAECPSLSPDGSHVAYKKRIGRLGPWDLAVLDLRSGTEVRIPDTAGIDDQAAWLDNDTLAYGRPGASGQVSSVFSVPSNGSQAPTLLVADASSPVPPS